MGIRIIIADDYQPIRRFVCDFLGSHHDMEVIGQAENGKEAIELCLSTIPDIAIVDVHMPGLNGIEVVRQIIPELSQVKVLILSGDTNLFMVRNLLRAGASGYIQKNFIEEDLVNALRTIMKGQTYLCSRIKFELITVFSKGMKNLTYLDKMVLQGLSEGKCIKDIALNLHLTSKVIYDITKDLVGKSTMSDIKEIAKYIIPGWTDGICTK